MVFQNRLDQAGRTVFVCATGEITVEELMENEKAILDHPGFGEGFNMLLDLSRARPHYSVDLGKVELSRDFVHSIQEKSGTCKWAVYAPDDYTYAFASMFEVISDGLSITTKVFRDKKEAMKWLELGEVPL